MKFTLAQYNIIRDLIADEEEAVSCDYANVTERFKRNFPDNESAYKDNDDYAEAMATIKEMRDRLEQLNGILDKFDEEF